MITKISKKGWEKAYYGKWLKAQDKTRRKVKWNDLDLIMGTLVLKTIGWKSLTIMDTCSYCQEISTKCDRCSLYKKQICASSESLPFMFWQYVAEMQAKRTNWKRANELVDKIVEAIRQDGEEWGYLDKNK